MFYLEKKTVKITIGLEFTDGVCFISSLPFVEKFIELQNAYPRFSWDSTLASFLHIFDLSVDMFRNTEPC